MPAPDHPLRMTRMRDGRGFWRDGKIRARQHGDACLVSQFSPCTKPHVIPSRGDERSETPPCRGISGSTLALSGGVPCQHPSPHHGASGCGMTQGCLDFARHDEGFGREWVIIGRSCGAMTGIARTGLVGSPCHHSIPCNGACGCALRATPRCSPGRGRMDVRPGQGRRGSCPAHHPPASHRG